MAPRKRRKASHYALPSSPVEFRATFRCVSLTQERRQTAVRKCHSFSPRPSCTAQPPVFHSDAYEFSARGSSGSLHVGRHWPVQTEGVGGPDTRTPIVGENLTPEHRFSLDALPASFNSTCDRDQSWANEWNLSSDSVRSEPNRCDPVSSECARMARFFAQYCALRPWFSAVGEPLSAPPRSAVASSQVACRLDHRITLIGRSLRFDAGIAPSRLIVAFYCRTRVGVSDPDRLVC